MESHISGVLDQILKRLDKMEGHHCQLDRVMERLDTVQNSLESLNQRQNLLEKTIKEKLDKARVKDYLQEAQRQTLGCQDDGQRQEAVSHTDNRAEATASLHLTTQSLPSWAQQIVDKLKVIDDKTAGIAQRCHQLFSWSQKVEVVLNKCIENDKENMKTFLAEVRSVKDLVKGQTNAELIWLNNQINEKVSHNDSVLSEILQQQKGMTEQTVRSAAQVVETVIKQGEILKGMCENHKQRNLDIDANTKQTSSSVLSVSREVLMPTSSHEFLKAELITFITRIKSALETHSSIMKKDLERYVEIMTLEMKAQQGAVNSQLQAHTSKVMDDAKMAKEYLRDLIKTEGDNVRKHGDTIKALISTHSKNSNMLILSVGHTVDILIKEGHTQVTKIFKQNICTTDTISTLMKKEHTQVIDILKQHTTDTIGTLTKNEYTQVTESLKQHTNDTILRVMNQVHIKVSERLSENNFEIVGLLIFCYVLFSIFSFLYYRYF